MPVCREIAEELLKQKKLSYKTVERIIKKVCREHRLEDMPTNVQILQECSPEEKEKLKETLITKPTRTISGVTIITVVAKPADCPGKCIYCPRGENAPQSYTGLEPAVQRAIRNNYDPFLQVKDRLNQFKLMGHARDKIEVIILGGTFLALPQDYQEQFIKRIFDALNGNDAKNLEEAQKMNEIAKIKLSGLTMETRADYCFEPHINQMLRFGATRVELGVQSIYPEILKKVGRVHTIDDVARATQLSRDAGLMVVYHMMPGLFVDKKKDLGQFKILFDDERFKPDFLKIYPTLVIKGTELYETWKRGEYKPMENNDALELLAEILKYVPKYCRINRMQRDISAHEIVAGVKKSNLRELVEAKAEKMTKIKEIRYREVGHKLLKGIEVEPDKIKMLRMDYDTLGGKEIFLSFEDTKNDILIGLCRMRIPFKPFRPEATDKSAIIRALYVYGPIVPVGFHEKNAWQHKGFGEKLLEEAERIAKEEFGKNKIVILSGIGVRNYYRKFGYRLDGRYVSKII